MDGEDNGEVNLLKNECSHGRFQIIEILYVDVIAAAMKRNISLYTLCFTFHIIESWRESYVETIYPCSNEDDCHAPDDIRNMHIGVPTEKALVGWSKKPQGRSKRKTKIISMQTFDYLTQM